MSNDGQRPGFPQLGDRLPKMGNRASRGLGRWLLRRFGWRVEGTIPNREKLLIILAPHTTARDFYLGLTLVTALGLRASWMGIDWLFRVPFMRSIGGIPADGGGNLVDRVIERFNSRPSYILGMSPEGSRGKVVPWKTGFYHIACGARVSILMISIDQRAKLLRFGPEFWPGGDLAADMERKIRPFYAEFVDRYSDCFGL